MKLTYIELLQDFDHYSEHWEDPLQDALEDATEVATHSSILVLKNPMDRGAWRATTRGVAKSQTWLGDRSHTQ